MIFFCQLSLETPTIIDDKYPTINILKKFHRLKLFPNNSNSIINDTISPSNTSHDFNLIMDETLTPALRLNAGVSVYD